MLSAIPFTPPHGLPLVGEIQLNSHGLMFFLASIVAFLYTRARTPVELRHHIEEALPWVTLGGILGARAAFVLLHPEMLLDPLEALRTWRGGLVSYGGMGGALLAWWIFLRRRGLPAREMCDALAPAALVGWGIGRIGCFLTWYGEFGTASNVPWAFEVDGVARHPVMLYLAAPLILAGWIVDRVSRRTGLPATGLAFVVYGLIRFCADFFRYYYPPELQYSSQGVSLLLAGLGVVLLLRWQRQPPPPAVAERQQP
ncbi:MAG: prolipoprotein diacylglyceryl transferase [Armatimonadetes bacterium]|nr:prolipoprotein diacylglyceryl transferase [Armatimonadota bacterium]